MKDIDIELFEVSDSYIGQLDMMDELGHTLYLKSNHSDWSTSKSMINAKKGYEKDNDDSHIYMNIHTKFVDNATFGLTLERAKALRDSLSSMILYLES